MSSIIHVLIQLFQERQQELRKKAAETSAQASTPAPSTSTGDGALAALRDMDTLNGLQLQLRQLDEEEIRDRARARAYRSVLMGLYMCRSARQILHSSLSLATLS